MRSFCCFFRFNRFFVWVKCPRIAATIAAISLVKINQRKKTRALFLDRSIFRADIEALAYFGKNIQYIGLQRKYLTVFLEKYIMLSGVTETTYHNDKTLIEGRRQVLLLMGKMLKSLHYFWKFDAIITCNFGYLEQQELFKIAQEKKWPIIILYKEGLTTQARLDAIMATYRKKLVRCDLLLCCNDMVRDTFVGTKVPGIESTKIVPVGIPRLDFYVDSDKHIPEKTVVLFSFFPEDKFSLADMTEVECSIVRSVSEEFHRFVVKIAKENPSINVIIKTKVAKKYLDYVLEIARESYEDFGQISNLTITNEGVTTELVKSGACVLGSHSTVLIEGLLAGRPVGCPRFPSKLRSASDIFSTYSGLITLIHSYDALCEFVDKALSPGKESEQGHPRGSDQFLEKYVFTRGFDASVRVEEEVLDLMGKTWEEESCNSHFL